MAGKPDLRAVGAVFAVILLIFSAAALWFGGLGGVYGSPDRADGDMAPRREAHGPQVEPRGPHDRGWGASVGFANHGRLDDHYRKHGAEFGDISREEYLRRAQALRDAPAGGSILEAVRHDRVITRYDRSTGAFLAFGTNGVIRTFFRPNDGERYFRRQLERDG